MGMVSIELAKIESNPFREESAYIYDDAKIEALAESIGDTSFWENLLARKTKDGRVQLAYGHHRLMALKKLVAEGMDEHKIIKLNVRPEHQLTNERMLKIFAQENKDDWGENPQNLCMTVLQLQAHLKGVLDASKDKDEFLRKIDDAGALKVDDRSFTRMKNQGVGATIIAQFLGDTWSRQTISDALQVIENDEATFKLAQKLPSVTLANRFQKLVTIKPKSKKEAAEMVDEETQRKVQDQILQHNLTRADVESAIKISTTDVAAGEIPDALGAIKTVVEKKKAKVAADKAAVAAGKPAPKEPIQKIQAAFDKVIETIRKEKVNVWSKEEDMATINQCLLLLRDVINEAPPEVADAEDEGDGEETDTDIEPSTEELPF